ncbi:MAG: glycine--tRNA ligase, partial [TACK group archaeon]|nr:glycine--tRNA ligase [TACK group archaeon]
MAQQEDLDELARRRGFFWPSYEIYGGVGGLYDLGPNGTSVKNRIIQLWRDHFIRSSQYPMVEIETPMVTPYEVLEASGHVESFTDPLTICPKC